MQPTGSLSHLAIMKLFLTAFFVLTMLNANAQSIASPAMPDSVRAFLGKSMELIQANAINRANVNWKLLNDNVLQRVKGATTYEELLPVYPYIFEQINDHHGALKYKGKSYYWKTGTPYNNEAVIAAEKKYKTVVVKRIGQNIGYVLLPGNSDFNGKNINADAQGIRNAIAAVDNNQIKGWIIDLRINTGGSMYQMLAGLAGILGEGKAGSFVDQHNKPDGAWIIKNGNIYLDSTQVSTLTNLVTSKAKAVPVAVLTGGYTASAGEVVAISFSGRKNTVLVGENSAGYTTANQGFKINKDAGLNLAVDFDADRNGNVYTHQVVPLIKVSGGDNFESLEQDKKIQRALQWLKKQK